MIEVIKDLKSIIRRYMTYLELGKNDYKLNDKELETLKKTIRYLELIYDLSKQDIDKGDNNEK